MNTIKDKDNNIIRRSKNLRLVLTHGHAVGVKSAYALAESPFKIHLTVRFWDGSVTSLLQFGGMRPCYEFIKSRRSWGLTEIMCKPNEFLFENKNYP